MTRNQHDILNDHKPSGSPSDGYVVAYDAGSNSLVWVPNGSGSDIHLENDDTTFSDPAVAFKDDANALIAQGTTSSADGASLILTIDGGAFAEVYAQTDSGTFTMLDLIPGSYAELHVESGAGVGYVKINDGTFMDIFMSGSSYGEIVVSAADGTVELYAGNDIIIDPDGDIDMSGTNGLLFIPRHAADPTGVEGGMYYNTATHKFRGYNGTTWQDLN